MSKREDLFNLLAGAALAISVVTYLLHFALPKHLEAFLSLVWVAFLLLGILLEVASRVFARRDAAAGQVETEPETVSGRVRTSNVGIALLPVGTVLALAAVFAGDVSKSWSHSLWIAAAVCIVLSVAFSLRRERS